MNSMRDELLKAGFKFTDTYVPEPKKSSEYRAEVKKPPIKKTMAVTGDSKFSELFNNEKSHKFMIHLIHSFTPASKAEYVLDWGSKEGHEKEHKCNICGRVVLSKMQALEMHQKYLDKYFKEKVENPPPKDGNLNLNDLLPNPQVAFGDKKLALESKESKTKMCAICFGDFLKWMQTEILHGNKIVHAILHKRSHELNRELERMSEARN